MRTEIGMRLSVVKVLGAIAASAASIAPMRSSIASFLHGRLQRISSIGCIRLQDTVLQVKLACILCANWLVILVLVTVSICTLLGAHQWS